jgi:hypothetical protein
VRRRLLILSAVSLLLILGFSPQAQSTAQTAAKTAAPEYGPAKGTAQDPAKGSSNERVPAGFHEFEMFGNTSVFLSHYPMFGSIHSYQVLLEVKLSGHGNDPRQLYLDRKKKNPAARYSVSPETPSGGNDYWVLPEVIKKGQTFRANIHWATTAGRPVYISRNVTVEIVRIIFFRLFQPDDKKPGVLSYLLFGNGSEVFLAHYIGSYPDFDQILAVTIEPDQLRLVERAAPAIVAITGRENTRLQRLLLKDRAVVGRLNGDGEALRIGIRTLIHYESSLEIQK